MRTSKDGKKEILWDRKKETMVKLDNALQDLVLSDREKEECVVVDFSVPWNKNVFIKEQEKTAMYVPSAKDLTKVWNMSTKIVPIVIEGLGLVSPNLLKHLKEWDIPDIIGDLQTPAIVGTYNILCKVLSRKE